MTDDIRVAVDAFLGLPPDMLSEQELIVQKRLYAAAEQANKEKAEALREVARDAYGSDDIECDPFLYPAECSETDDGVWVPMWGFVRNEDIGDGEAGN
jgi:hypothetical protein